MVANNNLFVQCCTKLHQSCITDNYEMLFKYMISIHKSCVCMFVFIIYIIIIIVCTNVCVGVCGCVLCVCVWCVCERERE